MQKYLAVLDAAGIAHRCYYWLRSGQNGSASNAEAFRLHAKVGSGWRNSFHLVLFNIWVARRLWLARKSFSVIHASDLDTVLPALLIAWFCRKKLIYDIYDVYSASRGITGFAGSLMDSFERFCVRHSYSCILPAACRAEQLRLTLSVCRKIVYIENVPRPYAIGTARTCDRELTKYRRVYAYVGILEQTHRGIENILRYFSEHTDSCLLIAGDGELRDTVARFAQSHSNIVFFGSVDHGSGMAIMEKSHAVLGLYYHSVPNHKYASPNKYYEHLAVGRPLITSAGTPPGALVEARETGVAVADTYEGLVATLAALELPDLFLMGRNARNVWESQYQNYFLSHMHPSYLGLIMRAQGQ